MYLQFQGFNFSSFLKSIFTLCFTLTIATLVGFELMGCDKIGTLQAGKYAVSDQEYSSQNYLMQRIFTTQGTFTEQHTVDHCLLMEMNGKWLQKKGELQLSYQESHNRANCHDSLSQFAKDSAELKIPIRNIQVTGFESFLTASGGKPEKWIQWNKLD